jgi:uncharacterized membrane protein
MILSSVHIIFAIIYLIIDITWITVMSSFFYKQKIESIQKQPLVFKPTPAVLAYVTLLVTMFFVCVPLSKYYKNTYPTWFVFGVIGFCVYGVYNFTNGAIFQQYDTSFMLVDTLWGCVSFSVLGLIYDQLVKYI